MLQIVYKPIIIKAHAVKYFTIPRPDQPFTKPHYPSKIAITLALIAPPVAPNTAIPTTILKEQQSLAQHFPHKPKNRTSSQVRSYLF